MLWKNLPGERDDAVRVDIIDLAFRLSGGTLAVEHAHALCRALLAELPWLVDEPHCGIHQIHVAASGNGWMRPGRDAGEVLNLSRRTRLTLRLPRQRLADAEELSGRSLDLGGHRLQLGKASERPLIPSSTLYARYVICDDARHQDEERFIDWVAEVQGRDEEAVQRLPANLRRRHHPAHGSQRTWIQRCDRTRSRA